MSENGNVLCILFYFIFARWGRMFTQREWGGKVEKKTKKLQDPKGHSDLRKAR